MRSALPLDKLEPYLLQNVSGWKGPLEVKQFNVGCLRVGRLRRDVLSDARGDLPLTPVRPVQPYLPAHLTDAQVGSPATTVRRAVVPHGPPDRPGIPHSRRYQQVQPESWREWG